MQLISTRKLIVNIQFTFCLLFLLPLSGMSQLKEVPYNSDSTFYRVDLALKTMDLVYVEINAGDALFFHSNLLHRSEGNLSDNSRWSLISCYNRRANIPNFLA